MKNRSLFSGYFTTCVILVAVCLLVLGMILMLLSTQYFRQSSIRLLARGAAQAAELTASNYRSTGGVYIDAAAVLPGYRLLADASDAHIFLADNSGRIILCSDAQECVHLGHTLPDSVLQPALAGGFQEMGRLSGRYTSNYYTVGMPVTVGGVVIGAQFASSSAEALRDFLNEMLKMFALGAVAVLILTFFMVAVTTERFVGPLRTMVRAAEGYAKGDFSVRIPDERGYDEVVRLARALNEMSSGLSSLESTRRSFVANVSHELKTPMTTIGGFIDGILDGTIPPEKERHYLGLVSGEVKRLSRLVTSMMGIARIEGGELKINPQAMDVNDVVCRVVFAFERPIEEKHLEIRGLDAEPALVLADADILHQIVYNLIENAVKFTPYGGYISISYETKGALLSVGVKNSGQGISKEELPRLFDRFYKTDRSRSVDKNGVGLGLYIVRSLVNLQGGEIMVKSVEGEYSEFIFSVPIPPKTKSRKNN